ncbi:geranylgeranyl diphosphate synthase type I [Antricoccus suffuscus]|uniref:Geranylgeranyl diphosphate synthase type I n=1 Tax=Antricoccus suffuscus TaxID=1629062 RepID=A0A2T0ZYI7_9ACTN|nr:polyprenyl synthetase family protein [Antricoccus suffuscus]PRZ41393.1 geranylgeranyl diphosphate synthase type I [Antricoccus suffuscus]
MTTQLSEVRSLVDVAVEDFLSTAASKLDLIASDLAPVAAELIAFGRGGKRIRPMFAYCGWLAAGRSADDASTVIRAVSALELVQISALVHDDIIDESDSRRGRPSVHRQFARLHNERRWRGDADKFGTASAILIGDLALILADAMLADAGLSPDTHSRVRRAFDQMRLEVMAGQYLDVLEQADPGSGESALQSALRVARLKSASYTVARPLDIGASIAQADDDVHGALREFGLHVGVAFQLRDDILGVFGDPATTGKPAGDDLREGKRTALIAIAQKRLTAPSDRALLERIGAADLRPDEIESLRTRLTECGAVAEVETMIETDVRVAHDAIELASLTDDGRAGLTQLADAATARTH